MQIPQSTEFAQTSGCFQSLSAMEDGSSRIYDVKKLGGGLSDCCCGSFTS